MMVGRPLLVMNKERKKIIDLDMLAIKIFFILNVYLVDCLNYNLLSVSSLCDSGYYIKFDAIFLLFNKIYR
jgi:hypothetical protein